MIKIKIWIIKEWYKISDFEKYLSVSQGNILDFWKGYFKLFL